MYLFSELPEIVVYCMNTDCEASTEVARELEDIGNWNLLHYAGGKQDWIRAGLPLEGKRASRTKEPAKERRAVTETVTSEVGAVARWRFP